jgi:hypothetical protein
MAKFYGPIGYAKQVETNPGVWREEITEKNYYGDVLRNTANARDGENLNPNLNIDNRISIIADDFASENVSIMRYVVWKGTKWQIRSIDVQPPRLILTIGGVYNEQTGETS